MMIVAVVVVVVLLGKRRRRMVAISLKLSHISLEGEEESPPEDRGENLVPRPRGEYTASEVCLESEEAISSRIRGMDTTDSATLEREEEEG